MAQMVEKLEFQIACADYVELDRSWNTSLFAPISRYVPYTRIYFPVSGRGIVRFDDQVTVIERGKIILIPPCAKVHLSCDDRLNKYWMHFAALMPSTGTDLFSLFDRIVSIPVEESDFPFVEQLFNIIRRRYREFRKNSNDNPFEEQSAMAALTLLLEPFLLRVTKFTRDPEFFRILEIMSYLNSNLSRHITLRELGAHTNMHPNYFSALFKKQTGMPPITYLNHLRMSYAMTELRRGEMRINEIAEKVGAANPAAFSKMFRKNAGVSPREYRRARKQGTFPESPGKNAGTSPKG